MVQISYSVSIILFAVTVYLFVKKIKKIRRTHQEDLALVRREWFDFGRNEAKFSLPIVDHCNSRTNYEFIKHRYDPETCIHCSEIQELLNER